MVHFGMTRHFSHATKGICCCDEQERRRGGLFFHKTAIDDDDDAALNSESEHCIDATAIAIDEYPREEAGFACTILHPRRKISACES